MVALVATLTFGASLNTLVSHPALYGWNWDYELNGYGGTNIPDEQASQLLHDDADVAAWTGVYFAGLRIDGQTVPVLGESPNAAVAPPVLSGHAFAAADEVVLGASTLSQLHKHVGDRVEVSNGTDPATELTIVGTATMPTVGAPGGLHLSMGTGALLSYELIPEQVRSTEGVPPGPSAIFVRLRSGANEVSARAALQELADAMAQPPQIGVLLLSVQHPAEIVNYQSMGNTPAILAAGLAAGATTALGLSLAASVRRRRRELALLKTLGFTQRQLAAAVAWHASVAAVIGIAAGVPFGVALGRWLWILFARQIDAVPQPTVPAVSVLLVAIGALVLANLVAAVPGRAAAHTPTARVLRAD
jgi:hypothetical protein